jgi:hypothetical protein
MEREIVGSCLGFNTENDLIILDDDGDEINIDNTFFTKDQIEQVIENYKNKRISFFYNDLGYDIKIIDLQEKQTCLCHNHVLGNYYLTETRIVEKLNQKNHQK